MIQRFILVLLTSTLMITSARAEDPERQRLLAQIEKEAATLNKVMDDKVADLAPKQKALREKVAQKEKTLRANTRKGYYTKNSQDALKKLRAELQEVDDQYRERLEPLQPDKEQLEQRRRAVVKKYPEPGDPIYVEHQGRFLTQDEWTLEKSRYPGTVAEEYIQELLRRGIIRSAKYVNTTRHAESGERGLGARVVDFQNVNYTVQYVSKGGVLNERTAWVTLITGDGTHWIVSRLMKETEVLGGLP
jgi:DNA repair exonuclease SbcCD ATPase subunit